jgi:hypothetical protein
MNQTEKQKEAIANYILLGLPLNSFEAIKKFGCTKLSTRIGELERDGKIPTVRRGWLEVKTRYCDRVKIRTYQLPSRKFSL